MIADQPYGAATPGNPRGAPLPSAVWTLWDRMLRCWTRLPPGEAGPAFGIRADGRSAKAIQYGIGKGYNQGVTSVKVGDRVVLPFTVRKWQQRVLVPAEELIVVPPDADPQQAAMMAINPVTAALLLDQYVDLQPGDAVVYNAATSGLAQWLAALAGRRGVRTIGLVRRREDIERVKQGGCEIVAVDDEEIGTVQTRLQGLNVRLALDVIGGSSAGRLAPPPSPYVMRAYCRGDDGFDAALAEITGKDRRKPGGITDQDEVFSVSVIKGLEGQAEDLTIICTVVDPKPEASPQAGERLPETSQPVSGVTGSKGQ